MGTVAFRTAKSEVRRFRGMWAWRVASVSHDVGDRLLQDHAEAMECRDCEDYLRLGLQAYRWLRTAHQHLQADVLSGQVAYDEEIEQTLTQLYDNWLEPCSHAESWAARQEQRGYTVDTATEFRRCSEEAREILEQRSLVHAARRARLRDSNEEPADESW